MGRVHVLVTAVLLLPQSGWAQSAIAFVDVNLIRMDDEHVEPSQTVVVRRDRIIAIGPSSQVVVPADAARIDAAGQYLLPGLTDAHVHLEDLSRLEAPAGVMARGKWFSRAELDRLLAGLKQT